MKDSSLVLSIILVLLSSSVCLQGAAEAKKPNHRHIFSAGLFVAPVAYHQVNKPSSHDDYKGLVPLGPMLGYEFRVMRLLSLRAQASYLFFLDNKSGEIAAFDLPLILRWTWPLANDQLEVLFDTGAGFSFRSVTEKINGETSGGSGIVGLAGVGIRYWLDRWAITFSSSFHFAKQFSTSMIGFMFPGLSLSVGYRL